MSKKTKIIIRLITIPIILLGLSFFIYMSSTMGTMSPNLPTGDELGCDLSTHHLEYNAKTGKQICVSSEAQ